jgi:hypothetical protein
MLRTLARRIRHFAGIVGDLAFRPVAERHAPWRRRSPGRSSRAPVSISPSPRRSSPRGSAPCVSSSRARSPSSRSAG